MITLPNFITLLRLPLIFLFIQDVLWIRVSVLFLAMCSDALDGYIARLYKSTSKLGTVLDPIADKVFVYSLFCMLAMEYKMTVSQIFFMISRDIALFVFGMYLIGNGMFRRYQFRSIISGKITTTMQFFILLATVLQIPVPSFFYILFVFLGLAALFELYLTRKQLNV